MTLEEVFKNCKQGWAISKSAPAIVKAINRNNGDCPCHNESEEKQCPCSDYRLNDVCHCNLYVKL